MVLGQLPPRKIAPNPNYNPNPNPNPNRGAIFIGGNCSDTCLNTTVRKFNNSNIGTINAIQKKFAHLHEMGEQITCSFLIKTLLQ